MEDLDDDPTNKEVENVINPPVGEASRNPLWTKIYMRRYIGEEMIKSVNTAF